MARYGAQDRTTAPPRPARPWRPDTQRRRRLGRAPQCAGRCPYLDSTCPLALTVTSANCCNRPPTPIDRRGSTPYLATAFRPRSRPRRQRHGATGSPPGRNVGCPLRNLGMVLLVWRSLPGSCSATTRVSGTAEAHLARWPEAAEMMGGKLGRAPRCRGQRWHAGTGLRPCDAAEMQSWARTTVDVIGLVTCIDGRQWASLDGPPRSRQKVRRRSSRAMCARRSGSAGRPREVTTQTDRRARGLRRNAVDLGRRQAVSHQSQRTTMDMPGRSKLNYGLDASVGHCPARSHAWRPGRTAKAVRRPLRPTRTRTAGGPCRAVDVTCRSAGPRATEWPSGYTARFGNGCGATAVGRHLEIMPSLLSSEL